MNPAIVGALIGAIPGTLAAGLATWSAMHSASLALASEHARTAAEHDRWLREKRADVYVDLMQFLRDAERRRFLILKSQDATDELRQRVHEGYEIYSAAEIQHLVARAYAYIPSDSFEAFREAWHSDQGLWQAAERSIKAGRLEINDELNQCSRNANKTLDTFFNAARDDLQSFTK